MTRRELSALVQEHAAWAGHPPAVVLLHAPSTAGMALCAPAPAVDGVPVAIVPAGVCRHRETGAPPVHAVLAMWKPSYLAWGERLVRALHAGNDDARVEWWPATDVLRDELCTHLATGPDLVIYAGHGRERGWTGYRGVRMSHVLACPPAQPVGALLAFTCRNLLPPGAAEPSFGERWVTSGRACAFLGAVSAVRVEPLERIGRQVELLLAEGALCTLADLVRTLDARLHAAGDGAALEAWDSFRVVGDPLVPVFRRAAAGRGDAEAEPDVMHLFLDGNRPGAQPECTAARDAP